MKYELIDCCPVPEKLTPFLRELKRETGCTYNSIYRGTDARALLAHCGKHDQAWLYANLPRGVANPPGRSTHELRSDGVAYVGPIGRPLRWWQCGVDLDDSHVSRVVAAARAQGWIVTVTYPGSRVEYHHVNFRRRPGLWGIGFRTLRQGNKSARVPVIRHRLKALGYPAKPDAGIVVFDHPLFLALKHFQAAHHLLDDGIYGPQTAAQLVVSYRKAKKKG